MHHDVGAQREGLLEVGRGEGVVDDDQRPAGVGDLGDRFDVEAGEQRIGRCLEPHETDIVGPVRPQCVEIGQVHRRPGKAERPPHLGDQPEGASVGVVAQQDPLTRPEQSQDVVLGGQPAGERETVAGLFE